MNKSTELVFLLLLFTLIGGFYIVLSNVQDVKTEVAALKSQMQRITESTATTTTVGNTTSTNENSDIEDVSGTEIPTSILFNTQSSPLLSPQTELTVAVEKFVKSEDGTLTLYIKVFSDKAESYSALKPDNLFEIVNIGGTNQKPLETTGAFDSIPPQDSVRGTVTFSTNPDNQEVILRIQTEDNVMHYRFNFENQNYEEAVLG